MIAPSLAPLVLAIALGAISCSDGSTEPASGSQPLDIAFAFSETGLSGGMDLYLASADGATSRRLLPLENIEFSPSWSPDGRTLSFTRENLRGEKSIWLVNDAGGELRQVPGLGPALPEWSPDGAWLAYVEVDAGGTPELFAVRPDGSGRRAITSGGSARPSGRVSWSSTGRIAFQRASILAPSNIWTVKEDGSGLTQLTTGAFDGQPSWSPDGRRIAYTSEVQPSPGRYVERIAVVNADGSDVRMLTGAELVGLEGWPTWSPDGRWILFHRWSSAGDGNATCAIAKISVDGGPVVVVSPSTQQGRCGGATWRPGRAGTP